MTKFTRASPRCLAATLAALSIGAAIAPGARANYEKKAEEQTDWIQANFYDAAAKRYHPRVPPDPKALPYDFMWANGVELTALVGATRANPSKYKQWLYDFRDGLEASYWDPKSTEKSPIPGFNAYCSGPGGTDKYYDDNEWLVLAFAEAYEVTHDPTFLDNAKQTQRFVLSGWDDVLGGGIYWKLDHKSKNTCSNAPAAAAALRLCQVDQEVEQLRWAKRICEWTNAHLQDPADGLYWDNINLEGKVEKHKFTYNTALMIRADVLLAQVGGDKKALDEARRIADSSLAAWTDPATGTLQKTEDSALFTHLLCESLLRLYDATHDVKYLDAVRREASFAYRHLRDPSGGYKDHWTGDHPANDPKSLILSAAVARLFWLLAPYQDVDELYANGIQAASAGDDKKSENLFRQAVESDDDAVEARYRLWRVLQRERKTAEAEEQSARLEQIARDPTRRDILTGLGWSPKTP